MPLLVVVEVVAPVHHNCLDLVGFADRMLGQDFPLQAVEERIRGSVVETQSDPAH